MTYSFKKKIFITLLSIAIALNFGCQKDDSNTKLQQSNYSELHASILATEYAIYQKKDNDTKSHLKQIVEQIKNSDELFCPYQDIEIEAATYIATDLVENAKTKDQDYQLDQLRTLKTHIYNLNTNSEMDIFLLYLWDFEKQMHATTKAALDPKLDLYEWNEFVQLTECLSEAWQILNHHFPTPETLGYDAQKLKTQTLAKDDLEKALKKFASTVYKSNTRSEYLESVALNLREIYTAYIGSIVNDPLLQYSYLD